MQGRMMDGRVEVMAQKNLAVGGCEVDSFTIAAFDEWMFVQGLPFLDETRIADA